MIGQTAADVMDDVERLYGPDATVTDVLVIVEVEHAGGQTVRWRGSSGRMTVDAGLAGHAYDGIQRLLDDA